MGKHAITVLPDMSLACLMKDEGLRHVCVTFNSSLFLSSFDREFGTPKKTKIEKGAFAEFDVLYEGEAFFVGLDDYCIYVIFKTYVELGPKDTWND